MAHLLAAYSLLLHLLFWGVGVALLFTPRRWRRYWSFFVPLCGIALQSAVVWLAARHTELPGTKSYALAATLIPLLLLLIGWRRRGWSVLQAGLGRIRGVALLMAAALALLLHPLTEASDSLTSISLGSCDVADYAAGARVLGEFARSDRGGFIGHTEVVRIHSVDNFFDYWLRLNHFTPSALLAFNNAVFHWEIHESPSIMAAVLAVAVLPLVFWTSRALFRLGPAASAWMTGAYALSPLTGYAVWHVALGQQLAAAGIALVTWCGVTLWRFGAGPRHALPMAGLLIAGYWVLLGSFNFIIVICTVPVIAYAGSQALWTGHWRRLARWAVAMGAPLVLTGFVFAERVLGLKERFLLFQEHDFGWRIPALLPDGWLGLVGGPSLNPLPDDVSRALSAILVVALLGTLLAAWRHRMRVGMLVLCTLFPIAVGYVFLQVRGALLNTNASYDAYKLLAVFYPVILPALCFWLSRSFMRDIHWRIGGMAAVLLITLGLVIPSASAMAFMRRPPLMVDQGIVQLRAIEANEKITSINLRIEDFWTRIWANAFLLKKPQYFAEHTYEGRRNTPLRGEWDLQAGLFRIRNSGTDVGLVPGSRFSLRPANSRRNLQVSAGPGWYALERAPREDPWRWTAPAAVLHVDNERSKPLEVSLTLEISSAIPRDLQLWKDDALLYRTSVGVERHTVHIPSVTLDPGRNVLRLASDAPAFRPESGDSRELVFMIRGIELRTTAPPSR